MSTRRPPAVVWALALVVATLAGCSGGTDDLLTSRADGRLAPVVQQIRTDLEAADPLAAAVNLSVLRQLVARMRHRGDISDEHAALVLAAAARVEDRLRVAPTTTTTTTTTTTAAPAPAPARGAGDDARGGGRQDDGATKGKGKGKP